MNIDWTNFTPYASLAGGATIGIAAAMLILFNGRIAGISGILGGGLGPAAGDRVWRVLFVAGLILAPTVYALVDRLPPAQFDAGWGLIIVAGLLVGVSSRYAAGCTSGHGVCGLSRLSVRSLAATATFMLTGFVTVYLLRHVFGG